MVVTSRCLFLLSLLVAPYVGLLGDAAVTAFAFTSSSSPIRSSRQSSWWSSSPSGVTACRGRRSTIICNASGNGRGREDENKSASVKQARPSWMPKKTIVVEKNPNNNKKNGKQIIRNKKVADAEPASSSPVPMGDLVSFVKIGMNSDDEETKRTITPPEEGVSSPILEVVLLIGAGVLVAYLEAGMTPAESLGALQNALMKDPQAALQNLMDSIEQMGTLAPVYYGLFYCLSELAGLPATPLTISAGVLLGFWPGVISVLSGAIIAASVAFWIGKTVLRTWVEDRLDENPTFARIDRAIGDEGFKLLLLVRLTPIFPFGLSSYMYGASSMDFGRYVLGTLLGFAPTTLAYVYAGLVGKELTLGDSSQPWYVYAAGFAVLAAVLKLITDVATNIITKVDDEGHISDTSL